MLSQRIAVHLGLVLPPIQPDSKVTQMVRRIHRSHVGEHTLDDGFDTLLGRMVEAGDFAQAGNVDGGIDGER